MPQEEVEMPKGEKPTEEDWTQGVPPTLLGGGVRYFTIV